MISPISAEVMGIRKLPDTLSTLFLVLVLPTTGKMIDLVLYLAVVAHRALSPD